MIDILLAADYFMITDLRALIQEHVKRTLSIDNSLELLVLSVDLKDQVIFKESFRFIQVKFEERLSYVFILRKFENSLDDQKFKRRV